MSDADGCYKIGCSDLTMALAETPFDIMYFKERSGSDFNSEYDVAVSFVQKVDRLALSFVIKMKFATEPKVGICPI